MRTLLRDCLCGRDRGDVKARFACGWLVFVDSCPGAELPECIFLRTEHHEIGYVAFAENEALGNAFRMQSSMRCKHTFLWETPRYARTFLYHKLDGMRSEISVDTT